MITNDKLELLQDKLFEATGRDWVLSVNHILTEPVCPTVIVHPEGWEMNRYRVDADTIEKGLQEAVERVYREVILRQEVGHAALWTNADDKLYEVWLKARIAGSNEKLSKPRYPQWA
jgi:hypothetical protein